MAKKNFYKCGCITESYAGGVYAKNYEVLTKVHSFFIDSLLIIMDIICCFLASYPIEYINILKMSEPRNSRITECLVCFRTDIAAC